MGIAPGDAYLVVPVAELRERKLQAIAAHRSQLPNGDPESFLRPVSASGPPIIEGLLAQELWTLEGCESLDSLWLDACASST